MTSTFASFHFRAPAAVAASVHSAARTPRTLFAAIDAPVPVQQNRTAVSAAPLPTSSPTVRPTSAHCSSVPAGGPTSCTSWPRSTSSAVTASVSGVVSSEPSATRTPLPRHCRSLRRSFLLSPVIARPRPYSPVIRCRSLALALPLPRSSPARSSRRARPISLDSGRSTHGSPIRVAWTSASSSKPMYGRPAPSHQRASRFFANTTSASSAALRSLVPSPTITVVRPR